jgi:hemolysin activation/secretion protein
MNVRTRLIASLRCAWLAACCAAFAVLASPGAQAAVTPLGPSYPVSGFEIEYALDHPHHIDEQDLLDLEIGLSSAGDAYTAPRPVDRTVRIRLSSLPRGAVLSATAIQHINQFIVSTFNRQGYNGVLVTVPEIDERTGQDTRSGGRTSLTLRIWTGRVSRVTTLADGERFASLSVDERTNNAAHEWIRGRAPVQPGGIRGLLDIEALEDYASKLSRHRSRRVDAELTPGDRAGTTRVNLRVAEHKPWSVYAQYSNTGTSATTKNRQRFGLVHSQLTGRDDVLRVDYTTGDFEDVHAVSGSYEAPFSLRAPDWRYRLRGAYSEFDSSEVGFTSGRFTGEQVLGGGNVSYNAFQSGEFFLDLLAGARWHQMEVDNRQLGSQKDTATFLVPGVGLMGERRTRISDLAFGLDLDLGLTDDDNATLETMGNPKADDQFVMLRWDGSYSFYLEPLIDRAAWEDPSTPGSSTLAHEVALSLRGQWAFNNRLVPQHQRIAGGLFTVRGYKQAAAAGDNLVLGTAEYRFHLPRILSPDAPVSLPAMGDFRVRPQSVYGRPDWDLVFRVFSDAARVLHSERLSSESNETLFSMGGGVEMQLLRNLSLRFDAGHVLSTVGSSENGDTRGHVLATVLY